MSCNRQCFDPLDQWHGHEDCHTCSGKDDGAVIEVVRFRLANWVPHAETQPEPAHGIGPSPAHKEGGV